MSTLLFSAGDLERRRLLGESTNICLRKINRKMYSMLGNDQAGVEKTRGCRNMERI